MHWGHKVVAGFIAFACFIGYMVYRAQSTTFYLVEKDYYKKELRYQDQYNAMQRTAPYLHAVSLRREQQSAELRLPAAIGKNVDGEIWLYCPDNDQLDQHLSLHTDENATQSLHTLVGGKAYIVRISWQHEGLDYYVQKSLPQ